MIGFRIDQAKTMFFDPKKVLDPAERADRQQLSKFGAFVRTRARSSMRKRKRASRPGEPPSVHVGLVKKFLYFVYESQRRNVLIGPAKLNGTRSGDSLEMLEHGGDTTRRRGKETVRAQYPARPFMGPAFAKELPNAPRLYRNAIK